MAEDPANVIIHIAKPTTRVMTITALIIAVINLINNMATGFTV